MVLLLLWHIWYDDKFMDRLFCVIFLVCLVSPAICHLSYVITEWIRQTSAKLFIENIFRVLSSSTLWSTHTKKWLLFSSSSSLSDTYVYGCDPFFDVQSTKNHRRFCLNLPEYLMNPLSGDILTKNVGIKKRNIPRLLF